MGNKLRYFIVTMLFTASAVNYADRSTLSAAKQGLSRGFGIDIKDLSWITLVWGISYVIAQIPSGKLLDRFGSRRVYGISIFVWSALVAMQGFVVWVKEPGTAYLILIALSYMVGLAQAPAFPGNGRMVAQWFPTKERGTASAIFNSSQYFATVMFLPLMGWLASRWSWPWVFWVTGAIGILLTGVWFLTVRGPREHPWMKAEELEYIQKGGALVDLTHGKKGNAKGGWFYARQLLTNRMLVGVYVGQFCITVLTYFFVQWVMPYLVDQRHMSILNAGWVAALPALCGFAGGVLGGISSDFLLRKGFSLTFARKAPIVVGMLAATGVVACNYVDTDWMIVGILCLAFFGKGFGALGWTVVSDTSPREVIGLCGGIFNMIGNSAQIALAYAVGYFVKATGSFNLVMLFVAGNAIMAILAYVFVVGPIKRLELKEPT